MNTISLLGFTGVYTAIGVLLMFGYRLRAGAALLALLALNAVMADAGKIIVSYPRPDSVDARVESLTSDAIEGLVTKFDSEASLITVDANDGYGFPSGHVAAATAFGFGLVFLFGWRWAWGYMAIWLPIMAISRMYLGRHFLGDVLGGFGVGVIAAFTALIALRLARLANHSTSAPAGRTLAPRTARNLLIVAVSIAIVALWTRLPSAYDAGRFFGVGVAIFLIVRSQVLDDARRRVRLGRLALAMLLFPAPAWITAKLLEMADYTHEPVGALLAGALPTAMLLMGPTYLLKEPRRAR